MELKEKILDNTQKTKVAIINMGDKVATKGKELYVIEYLIIYFKSKSLAIGCCSKNSP